MSESAPDTLTLEELIELVLESVATVVERTEADVEALQIELAGEDEDAVQEEAAEDVEEATDGVVSSDDYSSGTATPDFSTPGNTVFQRAFEKSKRQILKEAGSNLNSFTRQAVIKAKELLGDIDALLAQIESESAKITIAATAGLLVPPVRSEVAELQGQTRTVQAEAARAVVDLKSGPARRTAAKRHLQNDPLVQEAYEPGKPKVDDRFLEPLAEPTLTFSAGSNRNQPSNELGQQSAVTLTASSTGDGVLSSDNNSNNLFSIGGGDGGQGGGLSGSLSAGSEENAPQPVGQSFTLASPGAGDLEKQSQTKARASESLSKSAEVLQGSVIDKVSYIAICLSINGMSTSKGDRARALKTYEKLQKLVDMILKLISPGFAQDLQSNIQELASDAIGNIAGSIQGKLDAFDTFLSTSLPQLPTFVSTVSALGDVPDDTPLLDSIAAQCNLTMSSFCDMQGLLEVAKSLDAELGLVLTPPEALGRARLVVVAPEAEDYRPPTRTADTEANMLLVGEVEHGATQVVARFRRQDIRSEISAPVPALSGLLAEQAEVGVVTLLIDSLPTNIASLGDITVNPGPLQDVYRYSTYKQDGPPGTYRFTLIDRPASIIGDNAPVEVTGEQRDTFQGAFEQNRAIGGGSGKLALAGDGEVRQELLYDDSSFDPSTGEYTFNLSVPSAVGVPVHKFLLLCRPHQTAKELLYKGTNLLEVGTRFRVTGDIIQALKKNPLAPAPPTLVVDDDFDFTSLVNGTAVIDDPSAYDPNVVTPGTNYKLCIGTDPIPVSLDASIDNPNPPGSTFLRLHKDFHGGDQSRTTLSRVRDNPIVTGGDKVLVKLDRRQKDDMRVVGLSIGSTTTVDEVAGRVIVDGGSATVTLAGRTNGVTQPTGLPPKQTITSASPLVKGDEVDMPGGGALIEVQSGIQSYSSRVDSSVGGLTQTLTFEIPLKTPVVDVIGDEILIDTAPGAYKLRTEFKVNDYVWVPGAGNVTKIIEVRDDLSPKRLVVDAILTNVSNQPIYLATPVGGTLGSAFTVHREPQETLDFESVTNVDGSFYELNLPAGQTTKFFHGLQEPEIPSTVKIIPETSFLEFRQAFQTPTESVKPRFDGTIVPPGSTVIRAQFENPDMQPLLGLFVEGATAILAKNGSEELTVTPPNDQENGPPNDEVDGIYVFNLPVPTTFPLTGGDIIEVETTSIIDQLNGLFGDGSWQNPFDETFAEILKQLNRLEAKLCRLLGGRPEDLAVTANAINTSIAVARIALFPIRLLLESFELGLPTSTVIPRIIKIFKSSAMDSAAEALESGDVVSIGSMTPTTATSEGEARVAIECYRHQLSFTEDKKIADSMVANLKGKEYDKALKTGVEQPFPDQAKVKLERETEAAVNLQADAEGITNND